MLSKDAHIVCFGKPKKYDYYWSRKQRKIVQADKDLDEKFLIVKEKVNRGR